MNKTKVLYWSATGIFSVMMLMSGIMYFSSPEVAQGFTHLGFPGYFRIELGIAKIAGVALLLAPITWNIKEWAYAGFTITLVSASTAHFVSGDPASAIVKPIVFLGILTLSYITYHKLKKAG